MKELYLMFYSKDYLSLAITFSHPFGSMRIPRRKNASSFEDIHESTQSLVSSYGWQRLLRQAMYSNMWTMFITQENNFVVSDAQSHPLSSIE